MAQRGWGYWTEAKLDILSAYLPAFATASKKAGKTVYLDLFAGNEANQRRDTGQDLNGSAVRALATVPDLALLYFFELPRVAAKLEERLRSRFPGRQFEVVPGDCNEMLEVALASLRAADLRWAPTFAFIDPYSTTELEWDTLRRLADFKRGKSSKVELWLLLYGSAIPRVLGLKDAKQRQAVNRLFGSDEWIAISDAREAGMLNAEQARYEYTNLMRWRLQKVLGYERTHTLEIKNTSGAYLYDLIFATDNAAGDKIMGGIYKAALSRNEQMRQEAYEIRRALRSGQPRLAGFDHEARPADGTGLEYVREEPTPPYRLPDEDERRSPDAR